MSIFFSRVDENGFIVEMTPQEVVENRKRADEARLQKIKARGEQCCEHRDIGRSYVCGECGNICSEVAR